MKRSGILGLYIRVTSCVGLGRSRAVVIEPTADSLKEREPERRVAIRPEREQFVSAPAGRGCLVVRYLDQVANPGSCFQPPQQPASECCHGLCRGGFPVAARRGGSVSVVQFIRQKADGVRKLLGADIVQC